MTLKGKILEITYNGHGWTFTLNKNRYPFKTFEAGLAWLLKVSDLGKDPAKLHDLRNDLQKLIRDPDRALSIWVSPKDLK